jgi:hypothetical protein
MAKQTSSASLANPFGHDDLIAALMLTGQVQLRD